MTEISFHFNAPDKLNYACRLLRKTVNAGAKIMVTGSSETLGQLDALLWEISPTDFIAHCFHHDSAAMVAASPVLLGQPAQPETATDPARSALKCSVLVNLGDHVPEGFESFERLAEVVGNEEDDRVLARQRWKFYASRGYTMTRHDLASKVAP